MELSRIVRTVTDEKLPVTRNVTPIHGLDVATEAGRRSVVSETLVLALGASAFTLDQADTHRETPAPPAAAPRKPRRTRTPNCLTVDRRFRYTSEPKGETVPLLRMSGHWLEEHGFSIGGNVYVEAGEGRLILTNDDARSADLMESRA